MRSLSAHLRQPGSHGHLPFHPACDVCRSERLAGPPPDDALLSLRARSALVAGLLAASTVPATPAIADEQDSEREGTVDEGGPPPPSDRDPGFGEGEADHDLPEEESPPEDGGGPVGQTPSTGTPPSNDGGGNSETGPGPPGAGPEGTGAPTPKQPSSRRRTRPPATPPAPGAERPPGSRSPSRGGPAGAGRDRVHYGKRERVAPAATLGSGVGSEPPGGGDSTRGAPSSGVQAGADPSPSRDTPVRPQQGGRTHVVRSGESLWSVAQGELGERATPARVARLVNRLWELNLERIGTGDRNLIMVGTELRLPA